MGVQIDAGVQKTMLHHPTEQVPKLKQFLAYLVEVGGAISLPLKHLKVPRR